MIWLDLDETLVQTSTYYTGGDDGRVVLNFGDGIIYGVLRRGCCDRILKMCRDLDETRMLTMGSREYALAVNDAVRLGFTSEQITARENFLTRGTTSGWGSSTFDVIEQGIDRSGILIDNQAYGEEYAMLKCMHLGIDKSRYIQIPMFYGPEDNDLDQQLNEIECRLKNLKS